LRALSGLVIIVVSAVVRRLIAIVLLRLAADGQRSIAHVIAALAALVLGIKEVEGIPGMHLALEVYIVGVDADEFLDHRVRHIVAQRGLVNALVEPHAAAVV